MKRELVGWKYLLAKHLLIMNMVATILIGIINYDDDDVGDDKDDEEVNHLRILETRVAAIQMRNKKKATFTIIVVMTRMMVKN